MKFMVLRNNLNYFTIASISTLVVTLLVGPLGSTPVGTYWARVEMFQRLKHPSLYCQIINSKKNL